MKRRPCVCLIASGLTTMPFAAIAQQSTQALRIGYLRERELPLEDGFFDAMRELGWVQGQNFKIDSRYADNPGQLPGLATELVRLKVDLVFTNGTPATLAAKQETATIPIVFYLASDPVKSGVVASLATPGGNLTGFAYGTYSGKLLEILKAALPRLSRVAVAMPPGVESPDVARDAKQLGVQVVFIEMRSPESPGAFFAAAREAGADAALIPDVAQFAPYWRRISIEATKSRMPSIGPDTDFSKTEGLLSYGPVNTQHWPRVAAQIDKIFKGANPGDLPVEQPTRFIFVINLKAAKTLGLKIPQSLLLRANEVIQ